MRKNGIVTFVTFLLDEKYSMPPEKMIFLAPTPAGSDCIAFLCPLLWV